MKREVEGEEKIRCHETALKLGLLMQAAPTNYLIIDTSRHRLLCFTPQASNCQLLPNFYHESHSGPPTF